MKAGYREHSRRVVEHISTTQYQQIDDNHLHFKFNHMAIQLPQQPVGVNLPALPQNPPTLADVVAAKTFQTEVDVAVASQAPNAPTPDDSARADVYKTNDVMAHAAIAAAPAWFHPAMTIILAPIKITLAQTRNHQLHDGSFTPFVIVPFNDGSMPTQPPHNLRPPVNAAVVSVLTPAESTAYAAGYALGNVGGTPARRRAIGRAIGCTVPI